AAAAEQVHARRTVAGGASALLAVHLLAGAPDLGAVLDLVGAGAALGELPDDAALNEGGARLEPENRIRQLDRAGGFTVEGHDFQFHVTRPPARPSERPRPELRP